MNTTTIELSPDQEAVAGAIVEFPYSGKRLLRFGGIAGTGKTTTLAEAIKRLRAKHGNIRIAACAYTGRAASIIKRKFSDAGVLGSEDTDYCGTIHGLIYKVEVDEFGMIIDWHLVDKFPYDLVVIDEASMVDDILWRDLNSFGKPILAVGDHGQLPPVTGRLNLMEKPDLRLEKIHRQAEGNPIIRLAMMARTDGFIPYGDYGPHVRKIKGGQFQDVIGSFPEARDTMFLCGYNATRVHGNDIMRKLTGAQTTKPMPGEKVICLRNMASKNIFNGMIGFIETIKDASKYAYKARIKMEGGVIYNGLISKEQFGQQTTLKVVAGATEDNPIALYDFGYFLTVHKSQGSECDRVVVFEQRNSHQTDDDWRRWLYTAVTRAKIDLTIIGGRS